MPDVFNMKFANISTAAPEACLMRMAATAMADSYGIPSGGAGYHSHR